MLILTSSAESGRGGASDRDEEAIVVAVGEMSKSCGDAKLYPASRLIVRGRPKARDGAMKVRRRLRGVQREWRGDLNEDFKAERPGQDLQRAKFSIGTARLRSPPDRPTTQERHDCPVASASRRPSRRGDPVRHPRGAKDRYEAKQVDIARSQNAKAAELDGRGTDRDHMRLLPNPRIPTTFTSACSSPPRSGR